MMFSRSLALALGLVLLVAACDSPEERAEEHFEQGMALSEEGDFERAIVEFRNVVKIDGGHLRARYALARIYRDETDNPGRARQQYRRIVEQFPEETEAQIALAQLLFQTGNFDEMIRHASAAEEQAPEDPRVQIMALVGTYRSAAQSGDDATRRDAARQAETLLQGQPEDVMLRNILLDNHLQEGEFREAIGQLDWLIERQPRQQRYWNQRLSLLVGLEDFDAVEAQLKDAVELFDTDESKAALIRFYLARQEPEKAEAFLRAEAERSGTVTARIDLLQLLLAVNDIQAVEAELDSAMAAHPDSLELKIFSASLKFGVGEREEAVVMLREALAEAEDSEIKSNGQVVLARMMVQTGDEVGARALVEQILTENADNVEALKLQANWLIEADEPDAAVASLRVALDKAPEDAEIMTLMATAYQRTGRTDLAREFFALAVDASDNAPAETVRYAQMLIASESYLAAEDILLPALRRTPRNDAILRALGQLYLEMDDMARVTQVIDALKDLDTPQADTLALALETEKIQRENGPEQALSFLEGLADSDEAGLDAKVALVRARISTGDTASALQLSRDLLAEDPENANLQAMNASVEAASGNFDTAEEAYRKLLAENPGRAGLWLQLVRLKSTQGATDEAIALVEEGIAANPESANLLWIKATLLERENDIEGAIAIYEDLYARNSGSIVIANNLASLMATYRSDPESLERAWIIARRLRDTDIPAFQDTYGWIVHRRGESNEALPYLESAADGLRDDPIVQYHLAEVYLALGRQEDALKAYGRSINIAGPLDKRDQITKARDQIKTLRTVEEAENQSE